MRRRVAAYTIMLVAGLIFLSFRTGVADRARNSLAYADLVPQRGNETDPSRAFMLAQYDRTDPLVPVGATYLIGDSIAFKAPFDGPCIANRGLGGERSDQLLDNLDRWPSLKKARAVVIAIGTNDVWQDRPEHLGRNMAAILDRVEAPVYLIGLTAELDGIAEANEVLRRACVGKCRFIEAVGARGDDGIHLTPAGYAQIAARAPLRCS